MPSADAVLGRMLLIVIEASVCFCRTLSLPQVCVCAVRMQWTIDAAWGQHFSVSGRLSIRIQHQLWGQPAMGNPPKYVPADFSKLATSDKGLRLIHVVEGIAHEERRAT